MNMTLPDAPLAMWCRPGPRATAGIQDSASGPASLMVFLDPVSLVVSVPPFPDGPLWTARFLRVLARSARQWADELDPPVVPDGLGVPARREPGAHRLREPGSDG